MLIKYLGQPFSVLWKTEKIIVEEGLGVADFLYQKEINEDFERKYFEAFKNKTKQKQFLVDLRSWENSFLFQKKTKLSTWLRMNLISVCDLSNQKT